MNFHITNIIGGTKLFLWGTSLFELKFGGPIITVLNFILGGRVKERMATYIYLLKYMPTQSDGTLFTEAAAVHGEWLSASASY